MGLVSGISDFLSEFFIQLGGSNFSNIWDRRSNPISESRFKSAETLQAERQEFESYRDTVNFLNQSREAEINYLDSQITEARNFSIASPSPLAVGTLDRSSANYLYKNSGQFDQLHPISQVNIKRIQFNQQQAIAFEEYTRPIYAQVTDFINNLTTQKSLIESSPVF